MGENRSLDYTLFKRKRKKDTLSRFSVACLQVKAEVLGAFSLMISTHPVKKRSSSLSRYSAFPLDLKKKLHTYFVSIHQLKDIKGKLV